MHIVDIFNVEILLKMRKENKSCFGMESLTIV